MAIPSEVFTKIGKKLEQHCVPFLICESEKLKSHGSGKAVKEQGTMTLIEFGGQIFGITNDHVIQHPGKAVTFVLGLQQQVICDPARLIARSTENDQDFPFDIAIFSLEGISIGNNKKPIQLRSEMELDPVFKFGIFMGFPGVGRYLPNQNQMGFRANVIVATRVNDAPSKKQIFMDNHPEGMYENVFFPGISGSPIFRTLNEPIEEDLSNFEYEIVGIVSDGNGPGDSAVPGSSGYLGGNLSIFGFPINQLLFEQLLERRKVTTAR